MIDGIPFQVLSQIGGATAGWTLAGAAVWMVLTGRLVPRSVLMDQRQALEDQRQATAGYRAAYEQERDRADRILEPSAAVAVQVLRAIPASGAEIPGGT